MESWQTLLLAFGGNAALLAVLGLLGKSLLEKLITRDTARFESDLKAKSESAIEHLRSDLKAKSDATIEHLRNELQLKTMEHQVRFSRLHEKRAAVIAELYNHLVEVFWEAESFLSPVEWAGEPDKQAKHRVAMDKLVEFFRYFDKHRIYLPEDICRSLELLARQIREHVIKFGVYVRMHDESLTDHAREQKDKAWNDGWDAIQNQIPKARKTLEEEFRALLGAAANPALQRTASASR